MLVHMMYGRRCFFMNGKVYYIDFVQNDIKVGNMGVIKGDMRGFSYVIHLPRQFQDLNCKMYAQIGQGQKTYLTDISVMQGRSQGRYDIDIEHMQQWENIWIQIAQKTYGICRLQKVTHIYTQKDRKTEVKKEWKLEKEEVEKTENKETQEVVKKEQIEMKDSIKMHKEKDTFLESLPPMKTDKWDQLLQMYPQVHIFQDAETIVIKPKDLIVLTKEYQDLATNSFVLHAYYNYRQLLLIRYGNKPHKPYFIGVPGIYFEREKRVAMLFGFEGFENGEARLAQASGKTTYTGCFGYYVKQIDI